jgi:hypothetical protein
MTDRHVVVFSSAETQTASRLCDHLAQVGIEAQVINAQSSGNAEPSAVGSQTQVLVAESDQLVAQQIALEFMNPHMHHGCAIVDVLVDDRDQQTIDAWPLCPECGRKRHTMCPICETAGCDFRLADSLPDALSDEENEEEDLAGTDDPGDPLGRRPLLCPVCDEPFLPNYLRECEWCNYDFGYGAEKPVRLDDSFEASNLRVGIVIAVLVGMAALLVLWMNVLISNR